jgi:hypothetical protein
MCEDCQKKVKTYGLPEGRIKQWCGDCAPTHPGAIRLTQPKKAASHCEDCGMKTATRGLPAGPNQPLKASQMRWCRTCSNAHAGAVPIRVSASKLCQGCHEKTASYGLQAEEKARWCRGCVSTIQPVNRRKITLGDEQAGTQAAGAAKRKCVLCLGLQKEQRQTIQNLKRQLQRFAHTEGNPPKPLVGAERQEIDAERLLFKKYAAASSALYEAYKTDLDALRQKSTSARRAGRKGGKDRSGPQGKVPRCTKKQLTKVEATEVAAALAARSEQISARAEQRA